MTREEGEERRREGGIVGSKVIQKGGERKEDE